MTATATNYEGVYDANEHKGLGETNVEGATVEYKVGEGNWTTTQPSITNVGEVTYEVKVTHPNYETKTATGTLKVTPKAVTVTAVDNSKVFGTTDPELKATVDGTLGTDTVT